MEQWRVQRPATIWLTVKVNAENIEQALELADVEFSNGEYKEDEESFFIDYDRYWAIDEYKNQFVNESESGKV
jgi:hypothetical protein